MLSTKRQGKPPFSSVQHLLYGKIVPLSKGCLDRISLNFRLSERLAAPVIRGNELHPICETAQSAVWQMGCVLILSNFWGSLHLKAS